MKGPRTFPTFFRAAYLCLVSIANLQTAVLIGQRAQDPAELPAFWRRSAHLAFVHFR